MTDLLIFNKIVIATLATYIYITNNNIDNHKTDNRHLFCVNKARRRGFPNIEDES